MTRIVAILGILREFCTCWHTNLAWPRNYDGELYQCCLDCGALIPCKVELERKVA